MPHTPSFQLLLDAIASATHTPHTLTDDDISNNKMRSLGNKIIDLCQNEIVKDKTLTQNEILLALTGLISTGILINQKDPQSGITYAIKICEQILGHVVNENIR